MFKIKYFIFSLLLLVGLISCADTSNSSTKSSKQTNTHLFSRSLPNVPSSITKADEQALYMLQHYWDKFDFSDNLILKDTEGFEEYLANYFSLLSSLDFSQAKEFVLYPLKKSLGSILKEELLLYRKYFYEADSPMTNNEIYELVLKWVLTTPRTNEVQKEEARLLLKVITKNKVGTKATDFIYQKADKTKHHLHNLLAPYSLLVFAKSDCLTCETFVEQLDGNEALKDELERLKLDIVLIYLDAQEAEENLAKLPKWIISGVDIEGVILQKQLYDIKATPTFYLLRRGGEVLLKETYPDEVLEYLRENDEK